jgi:hypothetical protein
VGGVGSRVGRQEACLEVGLVLVVARRVVMTAPNFTKTFEQVRESTLRGIHGSSILQKSYCTGVSRASIRMQAVLGRIPRR